MIVGKWVVSGTLDQNLKPIYSGGNKPAHGKARLDRITVDPEVMGGQPCVRGLRIPVSIIVRLVASRKTMREILEDYPELEEEDVKQALEYAAWTSSEKVVLYEALVDLALSPKTVSFLRGLEYETIRVSEAGLSKAKDAEIIKYAIDNDRYGFNHRRPRLRQDSCIC